MTNRLVLLVAVATFVSAAGAIRAEEPSTQAASVDAVSRWTGARVEIQTAPTVDMPGVVKMQSGRDSIETARGVRIVAETRQALSACPPGCTAPVIIPKPSNRLVAVILAVDSGIVHLETKAHETVMLPVTAIASVRVIKKDALSGKRVRVDVGSVADLPSETAGPRPSALRDIAIAGAQFTEVIAERQETPRLVPAPGSQFEGAIERFDNDVLMVRLPGRTQIVTVPRSAIASLNVRYRVSHAGTGALIGAGVGLATGLALVAHSEAVDYCGGDGRGLCTAYDVVGAVVTTAAGALLGAVAGGMTHTEVWERIDSRRLSVAVMPDPHGGIRGRLAVRF